VPIFTDALARSGPFLAQAALAAAHELGLFGDAGLPGTCGDLAARLELPAARLRPLLDALAAAEAVERRADRYLAPRPPAAPTEALAPTGWGVLAEVIRADAPLGEDPDMLAPMHAYLAEVGRPEALEVAQRFLADARAVADLGGGVGTYGLGFLEVVPDGVVTLVERAAVLALVEDPPPGLVLRAGALPQAARDLPPQDAAVLANVLHLYGTEACRELLAAAVAAVRPGGRVLIKDLYLDPDRTGPPESVWFALNMALYTEAGDVHDVDRLVAWAREAGLEEVGATRLDCAPQSVVVAGRAPSAERGVRLPAAPVT